MFVAAEDNKNEKIIQRCFMRGDLRDFSSFFVLRVDVKKRRILALLPNINANTLRLKQFALKGRNFMLIPETHCSLNFLERATKNVITLQTTCL